jgi:diketogulonate reductase-like aldo/keto reductase
MSFAKFEVPLSPRQVGLKARAPLRDGRSIPWLGLGVYKMGSDAETKTAVLSALERGYRHVDTASLYGNERGVGAAINGSGLPREELFVTTKIWNDDLRENRVKDAFEESMARLDLAYVDLLLIHWPVEGHFVEAWKVFGEILAQGRVRSIGVSNFVPEHLERLARETDIVPTVNQVEYHPYLTSPELKAYCDAHDIRLTAWSPLMQGSLLNEPVLQRIGKTHGKTAAQVILRWDLQSGVVTIPKSSRPERMVKNSDIFDFALDPTEMAAIDALNRSERHGADPYDFDF